MDSRGEVTRLLQTWSRGDREALDRLFPLVYEELRKLARYQLGRERPHHTLSATALVHEAYLRLVDVREADFRDRSHFLAMASRAMRRLLVDHARRRTAGKRGGGGEAVPLDESLPGTLIDDEHLLELDEALDRLEAREPRQARLLEQHYFGGLQLEEIAEFSGLSVSTVKRDLRFARAWLADQLGGDLPPR